MLLLDVSDGVVLLPLEVAAAVGVDEDGRTGPLFAAVGLFLETLKGDGTTVLIRRKEETGL